ncbi:Periplasmic nitrate reductase [Gossypium arboreum]|uniref:Periplasmic nitrate reductase n=1 Tax=Gossypium arboreum TaxID=29729 RepID=A0A0B0PU31_GOSAR|nr:Periplasmic nitrate reductase [Gossypium arboreum]
MYSDISSYATFTAISSFAALLLAATLQYWCWLGGSIYSPHGELVGTGGEQDGLGRVAYLYCSRIFYRWLGSSKGSSISNLDDYVKDEKVSYYVQVGTEEGYCYGDTSESRTDSAEQVVWPASSAGDGYGFWGNFRD